MTETAHNIDGPDGNRIYGRLRKNGNKRLVVHIHGMTHKMGFLLEVTSGEFFYKNGYDHYRVSLYDAAPKSRRLPDSTLTTHTRDILAVIERFKNDYDAIYITAHSLGGLATLILNPQGVKAISLWDPSFDVTNFWASGPYLTHIPERKQYYLDYGCVYVIGEEMVEEIKKYPDEKCLELAKAISTPTQLIIPEESIFNASPHTSPEKYRKAFTGPFDLTRIAKANHTFSYENNRLALFDSTLEWFEKFA